MKALVGRNTGSHMKKFFLLALAASLLGFAGWFLRPSLFLSGRVASPRAEGPKSSALHKTSFKFLLAYPKIWFSDANMASNYDMVIFQNWPIDENPERVRNLKKLNSHLKVLFYRNVQGTWRWQENFKEIDAHESWFLHDASGKRVEDRGNGDGDHYYVMDLSNPEFRAYQIAYIMKYIERAGFDGLFSDGPPGELSPIRPTPPPPQETYRRWRSDFVTPWIREMKHALGSKLLITNSTNYNFDNPDADDADYFPAGVDGTMIEGFVHAPWQSDAQVPGGLWEWQMKRYKRNADAGKYTLLLSGMIETGTTQEQIKRWQTLTFASYLLYAKGDGAYYNWQGQETLPFAEQNVDLGAPRKAADVVDGVWKRRFEKGDVYVNPNPDDRTRDGRLIFSWTGKIILNN